MSENFLVFLIYNFHKIHQFVQLLELQNEISKLEEEVEKIYEIDALKQGFFNRVFTIDYHDFQLNINFIM